MKYQEPPAKAYTVTLNVEVVVWPREFGYRENAVEARKVAQKVVAEELSASNDVRLQRIKARNQARRDAYRDGC